MSMVTEQLMPLRTYATIQREKLSTWSLAWVWSWIQPLKSRDFMVVAKYLWRQRTKLMNLNSTEMTSSVLISQLTERLLSLAKLVNLPVFMFGMPKLASKSATSILSLELVVLPLVLLVHAEDTLLLLINTTIITFVSIMSNVRRNFSLLKDPKRQFLMSHGQRKLMTSDLQLLVLKKSNSGILLM